MLSTMCPNTSVDRCPGQLPVVNRQPLDQVSGPAYAPPSPAYSTPQPITHAPRHLADVAWEGQARVIAWPTGGTGPVVTEDEELAALSAAMIPRLFFAARWSAGLTAKLLPTVSATATFTVQTPAPAERIKTALAGLRATVDVVPQADGVRLAGHLGSGLRNMNPTVFVIAIRGTSVTGTASVHIRTAAREGPQSNNGRRKK